MKINKFLNYLDVSFPEKIDVVPEIWANENNCHNNCFLSGFPVVSGYYFMFSDNKVFAVQHSVIYKNGKLLDITPNKFVTNKIYFSKHTQIKKYINFPIVYDHNCILLNTIMKVQENNYYIYALIDPRSNEPFYIGKGIKDRWKSHLKENENNTENWHKYCIIKDIEKNGYSVIVDFLVKDIVDENLAYDIETSFIKKYGRICDGGILTNICIDGRPPNHKGKTYHEIYGDKANYQLEKRYKMQLDCGGWFKGYKHTAASKKKISMSGRKSAENRLSENDILEFGEKFCEYFNYKISYKKWLYFAKTNNMKVNIRKSFRFAGRDIFEIFVEKFNAKIKNDSLLWFYNPLNNEKIRCFDWEYEMGIKIIPQGFIRGRGFVKKDKE